ncbi:MAG: BlaI/MecI/CopY family transcriptional regulator [Candidatus Sumerlaeota bacterium]|nr:BlaI/MecI/CopY family transcriptional regulator [Candidatus Sumerlaeota bacterium]
MARRKSKTLTELELEIMRIVWKQGETSVEDVRLALDEAGAPLALPSIRTMFAILQEKGYLTRRAEGRHHLYRASVSEHEAQRNILKDVIERAFDGSALGLVAALIDARFVSKKDAAKARQLILQVERREKS